MVKSPLNRRTQIAPRLDVASRPHSIQRQTYTLDSTKPATSNLQHNPTMIPRSLLARASRHSASSKQALHSLTRPSKHQLPSRLSRSYATPLPTPSHRLQQSAPFSSASNKTPADEIIEDITELYATAQDEFEIAMEETEKVSVYAEEDRKAAREELEKVKEAFQKVVGGGDQAVAEEVRRRIGQRIRELENGVAAMEEMAQNQD